MSPAQEKGTPDVSVIIPYFSHGRFLHAAVQSALAATARPVEILIIDDGATETGAARHLVNARALSPDVRVISQANAGLSAARNAGLDAARGRYVQFLDSDDLLYPAKIDLQIAQIEARPGAVASICQYAVGDPERGVITHDHDTLSPWPLTAESFLLHWERGFSAPIHTSLFRADRLDGLRFDEDLAAKEDWVFWAALLRRAPTGLAWLPVLGALYRTHGAAMTRDHARMGEAFALAAERIGEAWGSDIPEFAAASADWRARFYGPEAPEIERPPTSPLAPHQLAWTRRANLARRRRAGEAGSGLVETIDRLDGVGQVAALAAGRRAGRRHVFDAGGRDLSPVELDRLRTSNGLFERIVVGDDAAVSLMGRLWSVEALGSPASARAG